MLSILRLINRNKIMKFIKNREFNQCYQNWNLMDNSFIFSKRNKEITIFFINILNKMMSLKILEYIW